MIKFLLIFLLGALTPLRFTPIFKSTINILPFLCFAYFFYSVKSMKPKQTFFAGLALGIGYFSTGIYWVYHSIHYYGNAPIILSIIISAALILTLSLFIALPPCLVNLTCKHSSHVKKTTLLYPASMMIFEWLRAHLIFSGFPWLQIGYSQTSTVLGNLAPIFGTLGLSLIVYIISGCLASLNTNITRNQGMLISLTILSIFASSIFYKNHKFTYQDNLPINVALIQGNIKQSLKYNKSALDDNLKIYYMMTAVVLKKLEPHSLIVWPEGAIPININDPVIKLYVNQVRDLLKQKKDYLITGTMYEDSNNGNYYNAVAKIDYDKSKPNQYYFKHNIVPFGEYFPLQFITKPIMKSLNIPFSQLSAGKYKQPVMHIGDISDPSDNYKIAPFICFDAAYSHFVAENTIGKTLVVIVSDDSWFGDSRAIQQQLQMSQMRARETGRYVIVTNNSGITAVITPRGMVAKKIEKDKALSLITSVRLTHTSTPFMSWGYYAPWGLCLIMLLLGIIKLPELTEKKENII